MALFGALHNAGNGLGVWKNRSTGRNIRMCGDIEGQNTDHARESSIISHVAVYKTSEFRACEPDALARPTRAWRGIVMAVSDAFWTPAKQTCASVKRGDAHRRPLPRARPRNAR